MSRRRKEAKYKPIKALIPLFKYFGNGEYSHSFRKVAPVLGVSHVHLYNMVHGDVNIMGSSISFYLKLARLFYKGDLNKMAVDLELWERLENNLNK